MSIRSKPVALYARSCNATERLDSEAVRMRMRRRHSMPWSSMGKQYYLMSMSVEKILSVFSAFTFVVLRSTMDMGAVAGLRRVKGAISVAKKVLQHTKHSLLAGDLATEFAIRMGHKEESLSTQNSTDVWLRWKGNKCQPNYWKVIYRSFF